MTKVFLDAELAGPSRLRFTRSDTGRSAIFPNMSFPAFAEIYRSLAGKYRSIDEDDIVCEVRYIGVEGDVSSCGFCETCLE